MHRSETTVQRKTVTVQKNGTVYLQLKTDQNWKLATCKIKSDSTLHQIKSEAAAVLFKCLRGRLPPWIPSGDAAYRVYRK